VCKIGVIAAPSHATAVAVIAVPIPAAIAQPQAAPPAVPGARLFVKVQDGYDTTDHPARLSITAASANKTLTLAHTPVNHFNDSRAIRCYDSSGVSVGMLASSVIGEIDQILAAISAPGAVYAATYVTRYRRPYCFLQL
jgi:hypothetical protein